MPTIDLKKVKAAVEKYAPGRICTTPTHERKDPVDAALRKPLKAHGSVCRSGFHHPHFLNGGGV